MTFGCHLTCWYEARNWVCFYILFYRFLCLQLKAPTANKSALEPYDGKKWQWNDNRHPKVFFTRILENENIIAQQRLCPSSATKLFEHYICVLVSWDEEVMSQLSRRGYIVQTTLLLPIKGNNPIGLKISFHMSPWIQKSCLELENHVECHPNFCHFQEQHFSDIWS